MLASPCIRSLRSVNTKVQQTRNIILARANPTGSYKTNQDSATSYSAPTFNAIPPTTIILQTRSFTSSTPRAKQRSIPATYYRGGTSRAPIIHISSLPPSRSDWAPIFRSILGSPDSNGRQLNGIGGGISSLSKICIVGPPTARGADVDFTFCQVGIKDGVCDYSGNCGNLLAAVGPYAVEEGMVDMGTLRGRERGRIGELKVVVHNTNTGKLIECGFEVEDGELKTEGDFAIDGVSGTGSKISLSFINPAGAKTGKLLPTGKVVEDVGGVDATLIDCGNPAVFVPAESLGLEGTELPDEVANMEPVLEKLETIRREAAVRMGLCEKESEAPLANPRIMMVSRPERHSLIDGRVMAAESCDIVVRTISSGDPHKAVPMTVALAIGATARLEGSVVHRYLRDARVSGDGLVMGHPSGKTVVNADFNEKGDVMKATVFRTARRIIKGEVYYEV